MKNIATVDRTKVLLELYGVRPLKRLGQNFLIQPEIPSKIASCVPLTVDTQVIEIGPGLGALTEFLVERSQYVYAIELDHALARHLKESIPHDALRVIDGDALKIAIQEYVDTSKPTVIFSNVPYYITTDIMMRILKEWSLNVEAIVLLVQKEVALKWSAKKLLDDASASDVILRGLYDIQLAFHVSHHAFYPKPDVHSAVIVLTPKHHVPASKVAIQLIEAAHSMKRKTIVASLVTQGISKESLVEFLTSRAFTLDVRPTDLSFDNWIDLAVFLEERNNDTK